MSEIETTTSEQVLRAALAGVAAFAIGYLLPGTLQLPTLAYDPVQRTVLLARALTGVQMRYFNDLGVASAVGLLAAAAGFRLRSRTPIAVAAGAALSLVALDVAYYLSRLLASV